MEPDRPALPELELQTRRLPAGADPLARFRHTAAAAAIVAGEQHVVELANPALIALLGSDPAGLAIRTIVPRLAQREFVQLLDAVRHDHQPRNASEVPVRRIEPQTEVRDELFLDFSIEPELDITSSVCATSDVADTDRLFVLGIDATERVASRRRADRMARELALRTEWLSHIIEHLPAGVALFDAQGKLVHANAQAKHLLGPQPDPSLPARLQLNALHLRDAKTGRQFRSSDLVFEQTSTGPLAVHRVLTRRMEASGDRSLDLTIMPLADANQRRADTLVVVTDVTEQRQAEEELRRKNGYAAALHSTALAVMNRLDLNDLMQALVERAAALLSSPHGYLYLVEPAGDSMVAVAGVGLFAGRLGTRIAYGSGVGGMVWQTGTRLVVGDYSNWPNRVAGSARDMLRALVGVPLRSGGEVVGVLALARLDRADVFTDEEVVLLEQFAELAAIAWDNARLFAAAQRELDERRHAEATLLASERRYRAIFDSAAIGTALLTPAGRIIECNAAAASMLGYSQAELRSLGTVELTYPDDLSEDNARMQQLLLGAIDTCTMEKRYRRKDGTVIVGQLTISSIRDAGGEVEYVVRMMQDVTQRKRDEETLRRQNGLLAALHQTTLALMGSLDATDLIETIAHSASTLLGTPHGYAYFVEPDRPTMVAQVSVGLFSELRGARIAYGEGVAGRVWATGQPFAVECYATWSGRDPRPEYDALQAVVGVPLRFGDEVVGVLGLAYVEPGHTFSTHEVEVLGQFAQLASLALLNARMLRETRTAESRLRQQLDVTAAITGSLGEGVLALDRAGCITAVNPAAERLLHWDEAELLGQPITRIVGELTSPAAGPLLSVLLSGQQLRAANVAFQRNGGQPLPVDYAAAPIQTDGQAFGSVLTFHDISDAKAQTAALEHQALHDELTGLPNRTLLRRRAGQLMAGDTLPLALLIMDLDGFREVNDTLGHRAGDLLLQQVARRLERTVRRSDTVARLGGDEFAILLPGTDEAGARLTAEKLLHALEGPLPVEDLPIDIGASIGIALAPDHGGDTETLLQHADVAMYVAKRGRSGYALYRRDRDQHSPDRLALFGELRRALDRGEIAVHYQPIFTLRTGKTARAEALLRWDHPRRGTMLPDEFVPVAEQSGLITPLTRWVLGEALAQCALWQSAGQQIGVAVNLSARTIHDYRLPDLLSELLARHTVVPAAITLEITEGALMLHPERALEVLARLHRMGVRLAIDDFGTGYSSLAYLKRLPLDEVKIDKSFVLHLLTDDRDAAIVRSTIDLAHNLGLQTVAEGVEDRATWDRLLELGCDEAQGFYPGYPRPAAAFLSVPSSHTET